MDDHEIVRRGVAELVNAEPDMVVVAEAADGAGALRSVATDNIDVAVLDVRLEDGNGISVCRQIRSDHPEVQCLILTSFADDQALADAALAGAAGYVLKKIRANELVDSIRAVAGGARLLDDAQVRMSLRRLRASTEGRVSDLSDQEARIFELIGLGLSNREIARDMFLAEKTVKNYVTSVLAKLGLARRTEVAALAARLEERRNQAYPGLDRP